MRKIRKTKGRRIKRRTGRRRFLKKVSLYDKFMAMNQEKEKLQTTKITFIQDQLTTPTGTPWESYRFLDFYLYQTPEFANMKQLYEYVHLQSFKVTIYPPNTTYNPPELSTAPYLHSCFYFMYDGSTDTGALTAVDFTGVSTRNKAIVFCGEHQQRKYRIGPQKPSNVQLGNKVGVNFVKAASITGTFSGGPNYTSTGTNNWGMINMSTLGVGISPPENGVPFKIQVEMYCVFKNAI